MAPAYCIQIEKLALKVLRSLPKRTRAKVRKAIDSLVETSRPREVKKLEDERQLYRIRVGSFRIVYQILDRDLLVLVVKIGHRKDIYR